MTGRQHKNVLQELKRKNEHAKKSDQKKDDNVHGRQPVKSGRITNTKNK